MRGEPIRAVPRQLMATTEHGSIRGESITRTSCPECGGDVRTVDGETWCSGCGLVVDEYRLDHSFEPKSFDDGPNRKRTGAPLTVARHDQGLSTEIGRGVDGTGRVLSGTRRREFSRLRKRHDREKYRTKAERNLAEGFGQVKRLCAVLDLPRSVRDRACVIFRTAQDEGLLRGRSIDGLAAASIYAACRETQVLRTAAEVADANGTAERRVRKEYSVLNSDLGLAARPYPPERFVSRFAAALELPSSVRTRAIDLIQDDVTAGRVTGSPPSSIAAAAVYLAARAAGLDRTQNEVAAACGTTDTTIRTQARALEGAR